MIEQQTYKYHLAVYSKLIKGSDPNGPIVKGSEARVNGRSADFPQLLVPFCRTASFFKKDPPITEIDPRTAKGGVFVYRPTYLNGKHYSIFARIEARSEAGAIKASRRFTHCAMIFVEDKWQPELIPWAADMLFTDKYAVDDPDKTKVSCWGDPAPERDKFRTGWQMPDLNRSELEDWCTTDLLQMDQDSSGQYLCQGNLPEWEDADTSPYPAYARELSQFLKESNLAVQGRWLNFGLGIGGSVEPWTRNMFIRYNGRNVPPRSTRSFGLDFHDNLPPAIEIDFNEQKDAKVLPVIDWLSLKPPNTSGVDRGNVIVQDNYWPDQTGGDGEIKKIETVTNPEDTTPAAPRQKVSNKEDTAIDLSLKNALADQDNGPDPYSDTNIFEFREPENVAPGFRESGAVARYPNGARAERPHASTPYSHIAPVADLAAQPIEYAIPIPKFLDTRGAGEKADFVLEEWLTLRKLVTVRPAFRQLIGCVQLLDPENDYFEYTIPKDRKKIIEAYVSLFYFTFSYISVSNPEALKEPYDEIFFHADLETLGIPGGSRPGILQYLFCELIQRVGEANIHEFVEQRARVERNLKVAMVKNGQLDRSHDIYSPQRQTTRDFIAWLKLGVMTRQNIIDHSTNSRAIDSCLSVWNGWLDEAAQYIEQTTTLAHDWE